MKVKCDVPVKLVKISDLKLDPKNRNIHTANQIRDIAKILAEQGWRYPVKVSARSGYVRAGHARIEAAKLNDWTEVPVQIQEYDSLEQEYADSVADNALGQRSRVDRSGVASDILELGPDLNVELLGLENFTATMDDKLNARGEWEGMPEFNQNDETPYRQIIISFDDDNAVAEFFNLIGQNHTNKTKSVWFPKKERDEVKNLRY